jgi:hypothetical protein
MYYQISCQTPQSKAQEELQKILLILISYIVIAHRSSFAIQLNLKKIEKK